MADCNGGGSNKKKNRNMILVLLLCTVLLFTHALAGSWANAVTVDDQRAPDCDPSQIFCHKLRTYNTWVAPQDSITSVPDLLGGPYAGSNVSVGGYVIKTPADLFAGMSFVANGSTTGELSINFNLDNDPALSLICPNGQTGMKMITEPLSCLRRVGINILNPQCALDVDDTICVNGVPIGGQNLPLAWYYQIDQNSPCNTTNVQEYFTPSAIDQVTTEAIDTVFVGYQGGAIAFSVDNTTANFGDCRGVNAVDFQVSRIASTQVASGPRSFIAGGRENTASGEDTFVHGRNNIASNLYSSVLGSWSSNVTGPVSTIIASVASIVSGTYSAAVGCNNCVISGSQSVAHGGHNQLSGGSSLVSGQFNDVSVTNSIVAGTLNTFGSLAGVSMFGIGQNINITATTGAGGLKGSIFAGLGIAVTASTPLPTIDGPMYVFGRYNDPDNAGITIAARAFTIGDGTDDSTRSNLFSILTNGDVHTKFGGTYVTGGADFQEYFEHAEGPVRLPMGTTVKILDDGMFRKANPGEIPDGVVSRRGGVLGNSDGHHWVGKYVMDDDTGKIKMKDGHRVISDKYDPSKPYIPREARAEWHTIGLVGQCEVLDGSPVDPRWVPMPRKAGARPGTTWYLIK